MKGGDMKRRRRRRRTAGGRGEEDKGSAPLPLPRLPPALPLLGIGEHGVVLVRRRESAGVVIEIGADLETEDEDEDEEEEEEKE